MKRLMMPGRVVVEPVHKELGEAVRASFVRSGACECGLRIELAPRRVRRAQQRTGDVVEHVYQHAENCPGGTHAVLDVSYLKRPATKKGN